MKKNIPGVSNYAKGINDIFNKQLEMTAGRMETLTRGALTRADFFEAMRSDLNITFAGESQKLVNKIDKFYMAGKDMATKSMKVESFFGNSDRHALSSLKNYNFDLIKKADSDLITAIRQEIWQGVARGDSTTTIKAEILKLDLKPPMAK